MSMTQREMRRNDIACGIGIGPKTKGPRTVSFVLKAPNKALLKGSIKIEDAMLSIGFEGYGEHGARKNRGTPILIEYREIGGEMAPQVHVFGDINKDELTHTFSLAGAAEKKRAKND